MNKWQLIETAPKDGTKILVCFNNPDFYSPETAFWGNYHPNSKGKKCWRAGSMRTKISPTHWMPLMEMPDLTKQTTDQSQIS